MAKRESSVVDLGVSEAGRWRQAEGEVRSGDVQGWEVKKRLAVEREVMPGICGGVMFEDEEVDGGGEPPL